jgi:hypothetical protein
MSNASFDTTYNVKTQFHLLFSFQRTTLGVTTLGVTTRGSRQLLRRPRCYALRARSLGLARRIAAPILPTFSLPHCVR